MALNPTGGLTDSISESSLYRGFAKVYPQARLQNAPKKRIDITAVKALVHINRADCHLAVIFPSSAVGACNQNLSQ